MKIVLGLGNPGEHYRFTRHNVGFRVADVLARRWDASFERRGELGAIAWVVEAEPGGQSAVLAKPRVYMNRSGSAGLALCRHYAIAASDLLVVHDDADLALGRLRIRRGGRAGGHNGIRSLIAGLGTEAFPRVKLGVRGVGRERSDLADYVLEPFEAQERAVADRLVELGADAVEAILRDGPLAAMGRFNGCSVPPDEGAGATS